MMKVKECYSDDGILFPGLYEILPEKHGDNRGYFVETYSELEFRTLTNTNIIFVQDNQSMSAKGVVRGLHFQKVKTQDKLVRVVTGKAIDVVCDLRNESPTFGKIFRVTLDSELCNQLFVPAGFAHGFITLEDNTIFCYKCSDSYCPEGEGGIKFILPDIDNYILSEKDLKWPEFDPTNHYFDTTGHWIGE